jgi:hypothetical protein
MIGCPRCSCTLARRQRVLLCLLNSSPPPLSVHARGQTVDHTHGFLILGVDQGQLPSHRVRILAVMYAGFSDLSVWVTSQRQR